MRIETNLFEVRENGGRFCSVLACYLLHNCHVILCELLNVDVLCPNNHQAEILSEKLKKFIKILVHRVRWMCIRKPVRIGWVIERWRSDKQARDVRAHCHCIICNQYYIHAVFYKNKLYKNTQAELCPKIKNKLRTITRLKFYQKN